MPKDVSAAEFWEELERIKTCREAISDLMVPEPNLHSVKREALSQLLTYMDERETEVMERLRPLLALAG